MNFAQHLYARAGFGLHYKEYKSLQNQSTKKLVNQLFKNSNEYLPIKLISEPFLKPYKDMNEDERKMQQKKARELSLDLNIAFLNKLASDKGVLREKVTLFHHGHFACRMTENPFYAQELNNIQRKYALGNFKTLAKEVSKSRAMLTFLNNQQNRKGKPNENFARELMELFTLGRGNYTEKDVKESARAFTGWMYDKDGNFEFREKLHDNGVKTFLGKTGSFNGNDIFDIIFEQKQTAYFITEKFYKFFVNETPNKQHIKELGDYFYNENYEITPLLKKMFTSNWFYNETNVGNKIKSPIEFLAGLNKTFYINYEEPNVLFKFQQALGQVLFYPPNVAGWNGGTDYIDSSTLMIRLKLPSTILNNGIIEFEGKADPDDEAFIAQNRKISKSVAAKTKSVINWDKIENDIPKNINKKELANFLLNVNYSQVYLDKVSDSESLKTKTVQILSTPEYQLC